MTRGLCSLLATLFWCESTLAQSVAIKPEDVPTEMVEELAECAVFYAIGAECIKNSDADPDGRVSKSVETAQKGYYFTAYKIGMSPQAIEAKFRLTFKAEFEMISHVCLNIDVLLDRYLDRCKPLIENPANRLGELLSGQNNWPSLP
jgi:hypothetical protein